ncbi:isoamyl alcohol oxidase [Lentithecium fluviatile CBS 122367]|uniref:Isoamyl alcohol oxidase n=1 Tax=Lentithecium fluviatile CBS 122367 TaxID=1168545 RepID=A0A6G1J6B8_9PLEO|nr:isoamyl alcohol oxidase [Lentithecium fluviatile CBS 122367]
MVALLWTAFAFVFAFAATLARPGFQGRAEADPTCRYLPSDEGWPSTEQWAQLNASVSGRLIATVPAGHVCHDPTYDAAACAALQGSWALPQTQFVDSSGFMSSYFQNATCDPYTPRNQSCVRGNYVEYAINVTCVKDVVAGLKFAQEKNIRLVIKNTGHDYLGKSTGKGGLSLWMHNLKSITFSNYTSEAYTGPAVKMGAGVQAFEAYAAADKVGLNVVGGQCPTVGIAGGYTQGGGHSLLSSKHGLGADQALEWEVVTANGTLVTASPIQNSDLYWALSGGGGGTYGVVLSLTAKAYPDNKVGGVSLSFATATRDDDTLWDAVTFFQQHALPDIVDAGAHVQWGIYGSAFSLSEATIPGATEWDMRAVFAPFTEYLDAKSIPYQMNVTEYSTFYEHANQYIGPLPYGVIPAAQIQGGVMISRTTALESTLTLVSTLRDIFLNSPGFFIASYALDVSTPPASPNAVLPAWRTTLSYIVIFQFWNYSAPIEYMQEQERILTEDIMPPLQELGSGAYMNEADFANPRWKEEFYGENYEALVEVKRKWDPEGVFWARTAVGSEDWVEDGGQRLCRVERALDS